MQSWCCVSVGLTLLHQQVTRQIFASISFNWIALEVCFWSAVVVCKLVLELHKDLAAVPAGATAGVGSRSAVALHALRVVRKPCSMLFR